jgi:hypothetical protein
MSEVAVPMAGQALAALALGLRGRAGLTAAQVMA